MHRRTSVVSVGLFAAVATLTAGCGQAFLAASPGRAGPDAALRSSPPRSTSLALGADPVLEAPPVADLSGAELGLPRVFMGLSYGMVFPKDRTLAASTVYDLNFAWDVGSWLVTEFAVGLWDIGDRPRDVPGADSVFEMRPLLAMVQFTGEVPGLKSRVYVGAGVAYSQNSYDLGPNHESYCENDPKMSIPDYDVTADDNFLMQYAVGWEKYSTADARLNLAIELRYIQGEIERVEWSQGSITDADDIDLEFYLLRFNVTWHF